MNIDDAISLVKKAVKHTGNIDQHHIDLTLVPSEDRAIYEKALAVLKMAEIKGSLSKDELNRRLHLDA